MVDEHYKEYYSLRDDIDSQCYKLWEQHKNNMKCGAGCSSCCQAFRILPIEFYAIKKAVAGNDIKYNPEASNGECKFLVENKCAIYEHRPVICRTHGYPLYRLNDEVGAYEISFCPLNFKEYPFENFNAENMYSEDTYNSKMFMLNKKFVEEFNEANYEPIELIELNDITW